MIMTPGKFEGEPDWLPELWERALDGDSDDTLYDGDTPIDVFYLNPELRARTDADDMDYAILMWETDQGFVCQRFVTERQLDNYRAELEDDDVD